MTHKFNLFTSINQNTRDMRMQTYAKMREHIFAYAFNALVSFFCHHSFIL
jgi:hypothetical protein